jgi:hypothetical protein
VIAHPSVAGQALARYPVLRLCDAMTTRPTSKDPRKERLAQALRDNLKRRKAQMRSRAEEKAADDEGIADGVSGQKT